MHQIRKSPAWWKIPRDRPFQMLVTIINSATSAVRNVVTGSVGDYAISNLPAGDYQLKVAKPGFSTYVQTGIVLKVEVNPRIDVTLQVVASQTEITVNENATMVES